MVLCTWMHNVTVEYFGVCSGGGTITQVSYVINSLMHVCLLGHILLVTQYICLNVVYTYTSVCFYRCP